MSVYFVSLVWHNPHFYYSPYRYIDTVVIVVGVTTNKIAWYSVPSSLSPKKANHLRTTTNIVWTYVNVVLGKALGFGLLIMGRNEALSSPSWLGWSTGDQVPIVHHGVGHAVSRVFFWRMRIQILVISHPCLKIYRKPTAVWTLWQTRTGSCGKLLVMFPCDEPSVIVNPSHDWC